MIKRTIVKREIEDEIIEKYCDICGKKIPIGLACGKATCEYCERDLCNDCIGHEDETGCDYRIVYCRECWDIGKEYRPKIAALIDEMDAKIQELYQQWQDKCKLNIKNT